MLLHWLWFAHRPHLTSGAKAALLRHFSDAEDIFCAPEQVLAEAADMTPEGLAALRDHDTADAEKILSECARQNIQILTYGDKAYPRRLKAIYDPPAVLYYKGTLPDFDNFPTVGVVGTRRASLYGLQAAGKMGYDLARSGSLVVSGMAEGIDGAAMEGAVAADGIVIGVLGSGVDVVYPRKNRKLYASVQRRGCILSEFAPGTEPLKWNFPQRNRIISGLSCGVAVIEAPERSGALLTAKQAVEQGRDVFVLPGNVDMASFVGSNRLLRSGAIAVSCARDILGEYEALFPGKLRKTEPGEPSPTKACQTQMELQEQEKTAKKTAGSREKADIKKKLTAKSIDNGTAAPYIDLNDILAGLSSDEAAVAKAIGETERLVDDVIAETGMTAGKVLGILTMLEIKGRVKRLPGKRVSVRR